MDKDILIFEKEVAKNYQRNLDKFCYSLFHGRGASFPGLEFLQVHFFPPVVEISFFKDPGGPFLEELVCSLRKILGESCESIYFKKRFVTPNTNEKIWGEEVGPIHAQENGLKYEVQFSKNQNCGFFLDMKQGRSYIRDISKGKSVLNLFSYTCSFSVAALKGGAIKVVNVDKSKSSLRVGSNNHLLNDLPLHKCHFLPYDIYKSWGKLKKMGPYDIIIMDPPSFQKNSFRGNSDYVRALRKIPELLSSGGVFLSCLNSPFVHRNEFYQLVKESLPELTLQQEILLPREFKESNPDRSTKIFQWSFNS